MNRILVFAYGAASYLLFMASFPLSIGFLGNFWMAKTLDAPAEGPWLRALLVDLGLLSIFALQHSGMARPAFKRWLTRWIPAAMERSTYVLLSSLALLLLIWQWQPLGGTIWELESGWARTLVYGGFAFGWLLVLYTTSVINHFDLFGLRQVWLHLNGRPVTKLPFVTPWLYRMVRHPLYVGWLCTFWFTPTMTVAHLLFALVTTAYILVAIQLEERDLMDAHPEYAGYRAQVPMLVPGIPKRLEHHLPQNAA